MLSSIRSRLTILFSFAVLLAVGLYSGSLFYFYQNDVYADLDKSLRNDTEAIEMALERFLINQSSPQNFATLDFTPDTNNWLTEIWSHDNKRVFTSGASDTFPLGPFDPSCFAAPKTFSSENTFKVRVQCAKSEAFPNLYTIRVSRLTAKAESQLSRFQLLMVFGVPLVALFSAMIGYFLAQRALAPISNMVDKAQKISGDNLSERILVKNQKDEIGKLANTFNLMFARLERSFSQMKKFTADAAHELRTPLSSIRAMGEVALRNNQSKEDLHRTIEDMLDESSRLHQLCENLLTLSRAESSDLQLKKERVSLHKFVEDAVQIIQVLAEEKSISILIQVPSNVFADLDPMWFRQVLMNLLDNSIKFSPTNSKIRVHASQSNFVTTLHISDEGKGIDQDHLSKVFDRFYRAEMSRNRDEGGAGLGLAIAKGIVTNHGGVIEIKSELGKGTEVSIAFAREEQKI